MLPLCLLAIMAAVGDTEAILLENKDLELRNESHNITVFWVGGRGFRSPFISFIGWQREEVFMMLVRGRPYFTKWGVLIKDHWKAFNGNQCMLVH